MNGEEPRDREAFQKSEWFEARFIYSLSHNIVGPDKTALLRSPLYQIRMQAPIEGNASFLFLRLLSPLDSPFSDCRMPSNYGEEIGWNRRGT